MATQEEVLKAIIENIVVSFRELKRIFGIGPSGSSWLPQRLKSLESKKLVYRLRVGNETYFFADPELVNVDLRGRPVGTTKINIAMEHKLLTFIKNNKIATKWQLRTGLRWDNKTLSKYIKSLLSKNMLIELNGGGITVYTTPDALNSILNEYYNKLYNF